MSPNTHLAVVNLKVVAALAEKLAGDLEGSRLWEGEANQAMAQIHKALADVPNLR